MPTECNLRLFEFAPVEGRQIVAALMAARSPRMQPFNVTVLPRRA